MPKLKRKNIGMGQVKAGGVGVLGSFSCRAHTASPAQGGHGAHVRRAIGHQAHSCVLLGTVILHFTSDPIVEVMRWTIHCRAKATPVKKR